MKIRFSFIIIVFLVSFLLNLTSAGVAQEEPYPDIKIPIYPDAAKVNSYSEIRDCVKAKNYHIQMTYPATKIVNFYEKEMTKLGFTELKDSTLPQEWIKYQDGTRPGQPWVRQFGKAWLEPKKKIKYLLVLEYETILPDKWNNSLLVSGQLMPYYEDKPLIEFNEKLLKEGKYEQFKKLMEKYLQSDGMVDCEKAIRENPANPYVLEYCALQKEIFKPVKCR